MNIEISKQRAFLFLAAIFLTNVCTMADMVIIPAVGGLFEAFDNATMVNLIITGPALVGVIFCILGGRLADKFNKKFLLVFGFSLFTATSILGASFDNVWYVLILRLFSGGISWGFTSSAALAIVAEVYIDETRRGTVMGWYNAAMAAIGAALSIVGGLLAVNSWQQAFNTYWISLPILLMVILFVPNLNKVKKLETTVAADPTAGSMSTSGSDAKKGIRKLISLLSAFFMLGIIYYIIYYQIALYVQATGIGNEAVIGTLSSLGTVGSCIIGLCFGMIFGKLQRATIIPTYFVIGLTFLALYLSTDVYVSAICCILMGAAWGNAYSYYYVRATIVVPPQLTATAIGAVSATSGVAIFLSTFVASNLQTLLGATSIVGILPFLSGAAFAGGLLSLGLTIKDRKAETALQVQEQE